jgi:hypothetical protein
MSWGSRFTGRNLSPHQLAAKRKLWWLVSNSRSHTGAGASLETCLTMRGIAYLEPVWGVAHTENRLS